MKIYKMILLIMMFSLLSQIMPAQVSLDIHLGSPSPPRYYYLQDIEAYYDIQASMYIFLSGGRWRHARVLPPHYGNYNFNTGHKIIINDYRGSRPYSYFNNHRSRFPKGNYGNSQKNYWSMKEYNDNRRKNNGPSKVYNKKNKQENIEFRNDKRSSNRNDGNRGNGRGNGKGNGHGKGKK